jgi:Predicted metal-dependent hydrolase
MLPLKPGTEIVSIRKFWEKNRIRVEILPDGTLEVTAPPHVNPVPFLQQKHTWIEREVSKRKAIALECSGGDDLFLFQGQWYHLAEGSTCEVGEDTVTYSTPRALKELLVTLLVDEVHTQIQRHTSSLGYRVKSIAVRMQKSRWGSCSGEGNLNFNLAVMALPPRLRTYVILHELVHLVERNHRPQFWERLGTICPEYRMHRNELKKYWILLERNSIWRVLRSL